MADYTYHGYTVKNIGYHSPDHSVVWEATDKDGNAVAHGYSKTEVLLRLCEIVTLEEERGRMAEFMRRSEEVSHILSFDAANDMGHPDDIETMKLWLDEYEKVKLERG